MSAERALATVPVPVNKSVWPTGTELRAPDCVDFRLGARSPRPGGVLHDLPRMADPDIRCYLDEAAIARLTDPRNYLGQAGEMVDRVLA
jgi:hypothetical protein